MNFSGKKLLILGANPETSSLVVKANEMGIKTYVTDYDPNAYAKQFAAVPCNIDASDVDSIYDLVIREKIDGIVLGVAERLIPFYTELCAKLNFPCYGSSEVFETMISKQKFKQLCRENSVPVVPEFFPSDYSDESLKKIILPVVVKPVDSCSSKGISVCRTTEELKLGIQKALTFSISKKIIIEKYMTGEEVVIYYVIQNGSPTCVAMCDRYTNREQNGVAPLPTSYIFPSQYTKSYLQKNDESVKKMIKACGIKNGVLFIQAFAENENIFVYEPGFRLNGAQEHYIVSEITGIDAKELMINFALAGKISDDDISQKAEPCFKKFGCKLSPLVKTGRIAKIKGLEEIKKIPGVVSVNPSYREGEIVDGYGTLKQIVCRFFVVRDTKEELKKTVDLIEEKLVVTGEDGNSMKLTPFCTDIILKNY